MLQFRYFMIEPMEGASKALPHLERETAAEETAVMPVLRPAHHRRPCTVPARATASHPAAILLLAVSFLVLGAATLPATAEVRAPAPAVLDEVVADTFSVAELATAAHRVAPGGRLFVSGVDLEPGSPPEALELERFRVFAPEARIVVHGADGETVLTPPEHAWFKGRVAGDLESLATLSVREDGQVRGVVQRGGRIWLLGQDGAAAATLAPRSLAARQAVAAPPPGESFRCGQDALHDARMPEVALEESHFANAPLTTTPYSARVAVETDWEFFQKFGNEIDAIAYVGDLFAYVSAIYDQEIDTDLPVVYLSLWKTSGDPWTQASFQCGFYEFGRYWNNERSDVDRTIAHFLSGKNNGGGVAWLGVLCNGAFSWNASACPDLAPIVDNYGGAYGYSGDLDGNFDINNPGSVWDWIVVSHEIGHNFNSPHTHCYNGLGGSSEPVDQCSSGEFRGPDTPCYSGTENLPCGSPGAGCGTIMSYCHQLSGGYGNIAPTFGTGHPHGTLPQRVPDRMRAHVESRAAGGCLNRLICHPLTLGHSGAGGDPAANPAASPGCPMGEYEAGEVIQLTGTPAAGWWVGSWSGTDDDGSTFLTNTLTMPMGSHAVTAAYAEGCDDLVLNAGTDTGTQVYEACGQITAGTSYTVGATGDVTLRSYQRVVLTGGFKVENGGGLKVVVP